MARKIHELRIFPSPDGEVSASDLGLPVLVVSQFTLYADTRKGRRPSWLDAAPGEVAEPLVDEVVAELRRRGPSSPPACSSEDAGQFGQRRSDDAPARGLNDNVRISVVVAMVGTGIAAVTVPLPVGFL